MHLYQELEVVHSGCAHHVDTLIHSGTGHLLQHISEFIKLLVLFLFGILLVAHLYAKVHGCMKTRHPGETGTYFHHLTDGQRNIYTNTGGTHRHGSVNTLGEYLARNAGFTECLGESTQGWQQPSCQGKYIFLHKFLIFIKFGCKVTQKAPN